MKKDTRTTIVSTLTRSHSLCLDDVEIVVVVVSYGANERQNKTDKCVREVLCVDLLRQRSNRN